MATTILSIVPELYSTKIAVSEDEKIIYHAEIIHDDNDLIKYDNIIEQIPLRIDSIIIQLRKDSVNIKTIEYVVAEGGLLRPCKPGVYTINKSMVGDLIEGIAGTDIINLGGLLAFTLANNLGIKSFVIDPASVDERSEMAAFTPHPSLRKKSLFHALIHKYLSRKYAEATKCDYKDLNIIFCHANERNVSVAAHKKGKVIDVNQAYMGYGPMGLCEIGTLPASDIIDLFFMKCYSKDEAIRLINTKGTALSFLETLSFKAISDAIMNKNKKAKLFLDAMAYQISKEIASHYVSLEGRIDVIILSGTLFSINSFTRNIMASITNIAPIFCYDKDYTFEALIDNALHAINSKTEIRTYI